MSCRVDQNPPNAAKLSTVDENYFVCNVQRVFTRRCSQLACHGQEPHAFRSYAPGLLRMAAVSTLNDRNAPLTLAEAHANFVSAQGLTFGATRPEDVPLIHKTVSPELGGGEHMGGAIFRSTSDPDFAALYSWASGMQQPGGCDFLNQLQKGAM